MTTWISKIRNSLSHLSQMIGPKDHIDWNTWSLIWKSLYQKENLLESPWVEFQSGLHEEGMLFEKITFGLGGREQPTLGKISLTLLRSDTPRLYLHKQHQEICSTVGLQIYPFWSELKKQSMANIQTLLLPEIAVSRLKLAQDQQIQSEEKILQWIKASLLVLKSAIEETHKPLNQQQFITSRILIGRLPLQDSLHILFHCFNLEIVLVSTATKAWKLLAYDHKDGNNSTQNTPIVHSQVELLVPKMWSELEAVINLTLKI